MAYKQPSTFLSGLAVGLGGQDPQAMALKTRALNQKKQADFIGNLQSNNLIDFGNDGVEIADDFYTNPEYKHLRKQLINSGGKALFQYYEKDGSVKQGAFEDIIEIDEDNIAIATKQADEVTDGAKTVQQGTKPDEDVALMPKSYLKRTTKTILNALLQEAAPGYGQEFGLQKKMLEKTKDQENRALSSADAQYQDTIGPLLAQKKELEASLAETAKNGAGTPEDTADAVIVLNEELEDLETKISSMTLPTGITHRDSQDSLSKGVIERMKTLGMSNESIQAQIDRNDAAIKSTQSFTGFWAEKSTNKVKINSKNIADWAFTVEKELNKSSNPNKSGAPNKKEHLAQMERTLESGGSLSNLEQRQYDKYKRIIKRYEDKSATAQGRIDKTIAYHQSLNVAGGVTTPKGLTKAQQLRYTKTGQLPTDVSGPENAIVSADGAAAVITTQMNKETIDPNEEKLRQINEKLLSEKNKWTSAKELITAKGNDADRSVVMMGMAKRLAQAAGVSADNVASWATAYYGGLENARITGNPQINSADIQKNAIAESKLRETIRGRQEDWEKWKFEQVDAFAEEAGALYEGLLDEDSGTLLDPNDSAVFKKNFMAINRKWQSMERARMSGSPVSEMAIDLQQVYEESIGLAILGRAYSKSKGSDIFDHLPGGASPRRWWKAVFGEEAGDSPNLAGIIDNISYDKGTGEVTIKYQGAETSEYLTTPELQRLFGDATTEVLDYLERKPQRTNDRFSGN